VRASTDGSQPKHPTRTCEDCLAATTATYNLLGLYAPWHQHSEKSIFSESSYRGYRLLSPTTPASGLDRSSITTHAITGAARFAQPASRKWIAEDRKSSFACYRRSIETLFARLGPQRSTADCWFHTFCREIAVTQ